MKDLSLKIIGGITVATMVLGYVYFAKKTVEFLREDKFYEDINNFNRALNNLHLFYPKR